MKHDSEHVTRNRTFPPLRARFQKPPNKEDEIRIFRAEKKISTFARGRRGRVDASYK